MLTSYQMSVPLLKIAKNIVTYLELMGPLRLGMWIIWTPFLSRSELSEYVGIAYKRCIMCDLSDYIWTEHVDERKNVELL